MNTETDADRAMNRFFFETEAALLEERDSLSRLGGRAQRLLAECVAQQGVTRDAISQAAISLDHAGFVFIRDTGSIFDTTYNITPSLAGEEAFEALEQARETAAG